MKMQVTEKGITIPKAMLQGARTVEVREEKGRVIIAPIIEDDAVLGFGENPVVVGVPDASEQHDRYLYGREA